MKCARCAKEIDPTQRGVWQKVVGWERSREAGGTNALALREPLQEFMHPECMVEAKQRIHWGQEKLV